MAIVRKNSLEILTVTRIGMLTICMTLISLTACETKPPTNEQLQQKAAQTTQQARQGAQQAAADARAAAANATNKVNAIAAGVREGLRSDGRPAAIDINAATEDQLVDLPGISGSRARKIIRGRPYKTSQDLVSRGILTQEQFDRISTQITAN